MGYQHKGCKIGIFGGELGWRLSLRLTLFWGIWNPAFFFPELHCFKQSNHNAFSELKKIKSMFLRLNLLLLPVENCLGTTDIK